jgi:Domain of unknown function (DUF1707)
MTGPGDEIAAAAGDHRHLRASHADREQVIGTLKAAFVQGRLVKDEFDLRVGQVLASRTYAELAALTADLPAGPAVTQPPPPSCPPGEPRIPRAGRVLAVATVVYAAVWPVAFVSPVNSEGESPVGAVLVVTATFFYLMLLLMIGTPILADWLNERLAGQLPQGRGPGKGGQASPPMPPSGPSGQLAQAGHVRGRTAEARRRRRPRLPGSPHVLSMPFVQ